MRLTTLILVASSLCGCAHTAVVKCWAPAEIDVAGIHSVIVTDFTGENGPTIAAALAQDLAESDFYTVVEPTLISNQIQHVGFESRSNLEATLSAAAQANVDGVIFGEVVEQNCLDEVTQNSDLRLVGAPTVSDSSRTSLASAVMPVVERTATVTIAVELVDVKTGEVRAARQISRSEKRQFALDAEETTSKSEMLGDLTEKCLSEFVAMLAPHEMSCEMNLVSSDYFSGGYSNVKRGLKLARHGDWSGAEEQWKAALIQNPQNHAALFNLSIASARRQNFDLAESYILDALKIEHKECYTQGLVQIRQRRTDSDQASEQRDARVVSLDPVQAW